VSGEGRPRAESGEEGGEEGGQRNHAQDEYRAGDDIKED